MKKALLLVIFIVGCQKPLLIKTDGGVVVSVTEKQLTDNQKFQLLRDEAKKRGLRWKIFCTSFYKDDPEKFMGDAWYAKDGEGGGMYWEQYDHWLKSEFNTQAEAAYALYLIIQNEPNHPAKPKEVAEKERERAICPPAVTSEQSAERVEKIIHTKMPM